MKFSLKYYDNKYEKFAGNTDFLTFTEDILIFVMQWTGFYMIATSFTKELTFFRPMYQK